ncbi:MAG TPA: hypothetical protein ENJ93_05495 [Chloroflexi bacterium]|nr:hypothetical protein [Chloroflexota bacterium]
MNNQLQDYVLDLLSPTEQAAVEQEAAQDKALRQALRQEREIGHLVRTTLQETTAPAYGRIPQLMPAIPRQRPHPWRTLTWQRSVAALAMVLLLFLGSVGLYQSRQAAITNATPTLMAATATLTQEPTATLAQLDSEEALLPGTAVAQSAPLDIQATPAPPTARPPITSN